jgi:group I intron endonuclease
MIIYKITNKITNKIYIGQTTTPLRARINKHIRDAKKGSKSYFHKSLIKYGIENFKISIICYANNLDELNHREKFCIRIFKSLAPSGYNLTTGGYFPGNTHQKGKTYEQIYGTELANKIREKCSKWKRNFKPWNKGLCGIKNPMYKKSYMSKENREKLSKERTGAGNPMYKATPWNKGIPVSKETKNKLSLALKGKPSPMKGKKLTKEQIEKARIANPKRVKVQRNDGIIYNFIEDAAKELGCSRHSIKRACINHSSFIKPYKGYTFTII